MKVDLILHLAYYSILFYKANCLGYLYFLFENVSKWKWDQTTFKSYNRRYIFTRGDVKYVIFCKSYLSWHRDFSETRVTLGGIISKTRYFASGEFLICCKWWYHVFNNTHVFAYPSRKDIFWRTWKFWICIEMIGKKKDAVWSSGPRRKKTGEWIWFSFCTDEYLWIGN